MSLGLVKQLSSVYKAWASMLYPTRYPSAWRFRLFCRL